MNPHRAFGFPTFIASILAATLAVLVCAGPAAAAPAAKLLDDLMAAYSGDSNAEAEYVAFTKKADQEGYAGVASLFRAAARGEEFHARNHAEHAKLMTQAASNLATWKAAKKFFVCQTCGLPVQVIDFNKCPVCFSESSDFIEVS